MTSETVRLVVFRSERTLSQVDSLATSILMSVFYLERLLRCLRFEDSARISTTAEESTWVLCYEAQRMGT
jgi:DNA polymerase III psi subunit